VRGALPPDKKLLEYHFVFACVWAFGGALLVDKVSDYRLQFHRWWVTEWKSVPFPEKVRHSALIDQHLEPPSSGHGSEWGFLPCLALHHARMLQHL
jgi:Dynein heavy chain AAA lid domain